MDLTCFYCNELATHFRHGDYKGKPMFKPLCELHSIKRDKQEQLEVLIELLSFAWDLAHYPMRRALRNLRESVDNSEFGGTSKSKDKKLN